MAPSSMESYLQTVLNQMSRNTDFQLTDAFLKMHKYPTFFP